MYGVIFDFLRDYTIERHGGIDTWNALLGANGHSNHKIFFPTLEYPDEQIVALAQAASQALDLPLPVFGGLRCIYRRKALKFLPHVHGWGA